MTAHEPPYTAELATEHAVNSDRSVTLIEPFQMSTWSSPSTASSAVNDATTVLLMMIATAMLLPVKKVSLCSEYVISTRVFTMPSIALWLCEARSNTRLAYSRSWNSKPCEGTHSLSGSLMKLRTGMKPLAAVLKFAYLLFCAVTLFVTLTQNVTSPDTFNAGSLFTTSVIGSSTLPDGPLNGCGLPKLSRWSTS